MKKFSLAFLLVFLSVVWSGNALSQTLPSTTETGLTIHPERPVPVSATREETSGPSEGMDVDIDTGTRAEGAMDVDVSGTTDADTSASGVDEAGGLDQDTTGTYGDTRALPDTASDAPLAGLLGTLFLLAVLAIRLIYCRKPA